MGCSSFFLYLIFNVNVKNLMLLFSCLHFLLFTASSSSSKTPLCRDNESSALLQFKQSISIDKYASGDSHIVTYPKTVSWKPEEVSDCCSWDGVECDDKTGHVIGLDLSSSFLKGSINSSSSLFQLFHLQKLNFAHNNFNYSQIPSAIGHLSRLSYLNFSNSSFSGQIPSTISALSKLTSLDLTLNVDLFDENLLSIEKLTLNSLLQNSTGLKVVHLSQVNISSQLPDILANLSSLTSLYLEDCGLQGKFPVGIFQLPNIQSLSVRLNPYLSGYLPEFNNSSPLRSLKLASTSFSGDIPNSIGNLQFLNTLNIRICNFSGSVPSSLGNSTHLEYLDISDNKFRNGNLHWLGNHPKLILMDLSNISLNGYIPSSIQNVTRLASLDLGFNQLTGQIPSWIANLTYLSKLGLAYNKFHGPIPQSISELVNLQALSLQKNNLSGKVNTEMFHSLKYLTELQLSGNKLSLLTSKNSMNVTLQLPKFKLLGLANCNLTEFPDFLRRQEELEFLELSKNRIHGQIPKWFWNISKETLSVIMLLGNFLTGFVEPLQWTSLRVLILGSNMLEGSLPVPPPSTFVFTIQDNAMNGEISPLFCNLSSLKVLDMSNNSLSGTLPECLGNFSSSLLVLNLRNNKFHGTIPQTFSKGNNLRMIDLSQNQLQGLVPRDLAKCTNLEVLNIGNNHISDSFPSFLGTLPELRVLILQSNGFHGAIQAPETNTGGFPKLCIIDLSYNGFSGKLPSEYFQSWNAMKVMDVSTLTYMSYTQIYGISGFGYTIYVAYAYSMTITNKGMRANYAKIPEFLTAIDFSSNKFEGGIPESIGNLQSLQLLNLSNNILACQIPSSLGNLTNIGGLDLSQNKLVGEIPQQLAGLTFLAVLNVSHNHLIGPVPHGKQFDTFENTSFLGNSGLCGSPLSKKCGSSDEAPPLSTSDEDEDSKFPSGYDWIFIVAGYGSGLVVGVLIGQKLTRWKHEWFIGTFGRRERQRRMRERMRRLQSRERRGDDA